MAILTSKQIRDMTGKDIEKKLKDLRMELIKSRVSGSKSHAGKTKEIKKIIARILTFNKSKEALNNK